MRAGDLSPTHTGIIDTIKVGDRTVDIIRMVAVTAPNPDEYLVRFPGKGIVYHKRFKHRENARVFAIQVAMGGAP